MKIDFHCHTLKTKEDESEKRNVSEKLFKEKIQLSEVKIVVITNHNMFDKEQYEKLRESVKDDCKVWPGIELDVIGKSGTKGHMILISDPNEVDKFKDKMTNILSGFTPDTFEIKLDELYSMVSELNLVYVVHCFKKKELPLSDIEAFEEILNNKKRLFKEPSSLTSITILQSNKHRVVIGTDVIDWENYEKYNFGEFKFEIDNYNSFTKIIEKDVPFLKDIVNEEFSENVEVYGISEKKSFPFTIPIYKDTNIIFGDKGSGKSEILSSLNEYYTVTKNENPVFYQGGDKENWYKKQIKVLNEDYDILNVEGIDNNEEELKRIVNFKDTCPISLKNYKEYFRKKSKKESKSKMKCLKIQKTHLYNEKGYKDKYNEHRKIANFIKEWKNLKIKDTLTTEELINFDTILNKLYIDSYNKAIDEWYRQKAEYLLDDFVANISIYVSENTGEPTPPVETGFAEYAKNRLNILKDTKNILNDLLKDNIDSDEYIGQLGEKGKVYLTKRFSFINSANKESIDSKSLKHNKGDLQPFVTKLEKILDNYCTIELSSLVNDLKVTYDNKKITTMEDFMSIQKAFTIDGAEYKPSKGEMAILALQHELLTQKEKNIFLIDEPDLSLGSQYINGVIIPLLKDLAKSKKIIVVATHDANIAVRTRPLNSILKITNNNNYLTYVGNMFTDKMTNISDDTDVLSWKEQSIKYLEGGAEAFAERGDLYE